MMYDAIVVGAGPVGSYTAYRLAQMGNRVVVLERKPGIGTKTCCTGIVSRECVEAFGTQDVVVKEVNSARLFSPSGKLLHLWRKETQACILDRAAFDMALASRAQSAGAEYILDSPVTDVRILKDGVEAEAFHQGKTSNFEGRVVVLAHGFGSGLSGRLGLGKIDDLTTGAQVKVTTPEGIDEVEVYFGSEIAPDFFAWLVPTSPGRARLGLMSRQKPKSYLRKLIMTMLTQKKIVAPETEPSYGVVPLKPLSRTYGERLIAVGDAAGQVKPTSGGGIYYGLLCASIAADVLHQALQDNDLSARRLARYEQRWKRKLGQELRTGYWARRLFEKLSDKQLDRIFDLIKTYGLDEALLKAEDLAFDWHGKAILRLMTYQMISKAAGKVRIPFKTGKS